VDPLTLTVALITAAITAFGACYTYLAYKRLHKPPIDAPQSNKMAGTKDFVLARLLSLLWHYPEGGGNRVSWAVKESGVLRGLLENAKEEPGLGIAIVTTELALEVFGAEANSRIDGCVTWALANSLPVFPYLLKGKESDSRTSKEKVVPDFRHSLAFAIILARTGKLVDRVSTYLHHALSMQNPDGGWPEGEGRTISEVFTVLYAIEFLSLCGGREQLPNDIRSQAISSRERAVQWLLSNTCERGMWKSGVLSEYVWDDVVTTAWILHRLAPIKGIAAQSWDDGVSQASLNMVSKVGDPATWRGCPDVQRFRAESRVAASVSSVLATRRSASSDLESLRIYLSDWRRRVQVLAEKIPDPDLDVGTAAFVLRGLYSTNEMRRWVEKVRLTRL
jgi:hypothetical protein